MLSPTTFGAAGDPDHHPESDSAVELQIQEMFSVNGSGPIVAGVLLQGQVGLADTLKLGPNHAGGFDSVTVVSIHRNGQSAQSVCQGETASFELSGVSASQLRSGLALVSPGLAQAGLTFSAEVKLLSPGPELMAEALQVLVVIGTVRQVALLSTGSAIGFNGTTVAELTFMHMPEYVSPSLPLYFKAAQQVGVGKIMALPAPDS